MKPHPSIPCFQKYRGKRYFSHTVVIEQSALEWQRELIVDHVIAPSPEEAIEWVRANVPLPVVDYPANWTSWGPKGGKVFRYSGWFMTVGNALIRGISSYRQQPLPFEQTT